MISSVIAFEVSCVVALLALYRFAPTDNLATLSVSTRGKVCLIALVIAAVSAAIAVLQWKSLDHRARRKAALAIATNGIVIVSALLSAEVGIRVYQYIAEKPPVLKDWRETSELFLSAVTEPPGRHSYHQFDPDLGWSIGANRSSKDGWYHSNQDGLRSPAMGAVVENGSRSGAVVRKARHQAPYRVALIGDSFTFGYEVQFEDTWGFSLSSSLGDNVEILNFGVIGYSANQIRMRYERDVRPQRPDVVIVGLISDDLIRDMFVYNFLYAPRFVALPYVRPRPVLKDGHLEILNYPLLPPEEVFRCPELQALPYLAHDMNYNWLEWRRSPWILLQRSATFRTLTSWPDIQMPERTQAFYEEAMLVEREVLTSLSASIRRDGARSLFVYFPTQAELDNSTTLPFVVSNVLDALHIPYFDATDCVKALPSADRFARYGHYSAKTNRAISECLLPQLQHNTLNRLS